MRVTPAARATVSKRSPKTVDLGQINSTDPCEHPRSNARASEIQANNQSPRSFHFGTQLALTGVAANCNKGSEQSVRDEIRFEASARLPSKEANL